MYTKPVLHCTLALIRASILRELYTMSVKQHILQSYVYTLFSLVRRRSPTQVLFSVLSNRHSARANAPYARTATSSPLAART